MLLPPFQHSVDNWDESQSESADVCDVADDAAIVRIESQFGETNFADMFTLIKDGDD